MVRTTTGSVEEDVPGQRGSLRFVDPMGEKEGGRGRGAGVWHIGRKPLHDAWRLTIPELKIMLKQEMKEAQAKEGERRKAEGGGEVVWEVGWGRGQGRPSTHQQRRHSRSGNNSSSGSNGGDDSGDGEEKKLCLPASPALHPPGYQRYRRDGHNSSYVLCGAGLHPSR